jgi:hypothetical protein
MGRLFAVVLALTCAVAATPGFARGGMGHGFGRGGVMRDPMLRLPSPSAAPGMTNRIPAPLSPPAQAPVINGPISQPAFRGLTGIGE